MAKIKEYKNKKERLEIVMNIIQQLQDLNIMGFNGVEKMMIIMKEYVNIDTSIQTGGFTGKIKIQELEREIHYTLPLLKHANPMFLLKYSKN